MKVYYVRESENIDDSIDVGKVFFPESVLNRIMKKKGKSRSRSALAYLLLRYCLIENGKKEYFDRIRFGETGKPCIDGVEFSLSHTTGMAVCAINSSPVGVDVEKIKSLPEYSIKRFIDEDRLKKIYLSDDIDCLTLEQWVIKEAYLKDVGIGISVNLKSLVPSQKSKHVWQINGHNIEVKRAEDYIIAVSSQEYFSVNLTQVRFNDII